MAANMMELLKQIQRDQKSYMKNLHDMNAYINNRLNIMEGKMTELDKSIIECKLTALEKKMDHQDITQQHILATIDRLEKQITKNNLLLFGNDGTETNFEDKTTDYQKPVLTDLRNAEHSMKQSESLKKKIEATQLQNPSDVELNEETELNCENGDKNNDHFQNTDNDDEILNKASSIGAENIESEETAAILLKKSTYCTTDFVLLDDKLNKITDMYQSDMRDLEELIMDIVTEIKISVEEAVSDVYKQDTEQISNTYKELKEIAETNNCAVKEIKEIIKNYVNKKTPGQRTSQEQEVVQISPAYFSVDQLSKLNSRLKLVAETCQEANISPIIEVLSDHDQHPIIKQLIEGVYYEKINRCSESLMFRFKFGTCESEKFYIIDLIGRYPSLTFNEVVKICLIHCNKWEENSKIYDLGKPMIYNKRGDLVRLIIS